MHERDTETFGRLGQGPQCVEREEPMYVIKPRHDDALVLPRKNDRLVGQNIKPQLIERLSHISRVVIAENGQPTIFHTNRSNQVGEWPGRGSQWRAVV